MVLILFFDTRHPGEPVLTVMSYPWALWWGLWLNPKGASFVLLYKQTRWGFVGMVRGRGGGALWLSLLISDGFVPRLGPIFRL